MYSDLHEYSADTNAWTRLDDGTTANNPGARLWHATLFFGGRLYVHGGQYGQSHCPADNLSVQDSLLNTRAARTSLMVDLALLQMQIGAD